MCFHHHHHHTPRDKIGYIIAQPFDLDDEEEVKKDHKNILYAHCHQNQNQKGK